MTDQTATRPPLPHGAPAPHTLDIPGSAWLSDGTVHGHEPQVAVYAANMPSGPGGWMPQTWEFDASVQRSRDRVWVIVAIVASVLMAVGAAGLVTLGLVVDDAVQEQEQLAADEADRPATVDEVLEDLDTTSFEDDYEYLSEPLAGPCPAGVNASALASTYTVSYTTSAAGWSPSDDYYDYESASGDTMYVHTDTPFTTADPATPDAYLADQLAERREFSYNGDSLQMQRLMRPGTKVFGVGASGATFDSPSPETIYVADLCGERVIVEFRAPYGTEVTPARLASYERALAGMRIA